jgi:hypothetical protein
LSESGSSRSKTKSGFSSFDLHVGETCSLKPGAQSAAVDWHIRVSNMCQTKKNPGNTVGSSENRARPEDSVDFAEKLIL